MTPLSDGTSIDDEDKMTPSKTWKTEKTFVIGESKKACSPICAFTSSKSTTSNTATNDELECTEEYERHDTASRRSILEKRNIFEGTSASSPSKDSPDPAMLPLSQRKALFEKNRSVTKPIARFGESVTPAMLSKAKKLKTPEVSFRVSVPASEPTWKRKREVSPQRFLNTPGPSSKRSPAKEAETNDDNSKIIGIHKRFEKSRRLFENVSNDWRENDIAKTSDVARRKDMEILMNRFNKQREMEEPEKEQFKGEAEAKISQTQEIQPLNYPGIDSLKRIKVSPPKPGQLYPDLNDIYASDPTSEIDRPETAMSDESCAPSEAPSLGSAIKRVASTNKPFHMPPISVVSIQCKYQLRSLLQNIC